MFYAAASSVPKTEEEQALEELALTGEEAVETDGGPDPVPDQNDPRWRSVCLSQHLHRVRTELTRIDQYVEGQVQAEIKRIWAEEGVEYTEEEPKKFLDEIRNRSRVTADTRDRIEADLKRRLNDLADKIEHEFAPGVIEKMRKSCPKAFGTDMKIRRE